MSLDTNLQNLAVRAATEAKALRTLINGNAADLSALDTTDKTNLVNAINEVAAASGVAAATDTVAGIVELATTAEVTTGTDTTRAVTPAGVQAAIDALVAAAPGLLNTLDELAAALGDDPNFATTMTTALAGKQPLDADLTAIAALVSAADKVPYATGSGTWALATVTSFARSLLDDADAATARTTLDVWSKTEVGSVTTDFVAVFEAGLV